MFVQLIDELAALPVAELDRRLAAAKRKRDEADMELAAITAVVDRRGLFRDHGHRSVGGYLRQQLDWPAGEARRLKRRGRLLDEHPDIGDLLGASRIGVAKVDLLADAHRHPVAGERFGEFAALLTEQAAELEYPSFKTAVAHFVAQADPDGSFDDQQFREDHRCASVGESNGAVTVHAFGGDPVQAAEMKAIFDRAVEAEFRRDCEDRRAAHGDDALAHPLARSAAQRGFDALHRIFVDSAAAPADGKHPEPLVNIVIDPATGIEALARHGLLDVEEPAGVPDEPGDPVDPTDRRCQLSTGTPVHPDVAVKAMIRGRIRRVVVDAHGVVIDLGRTRRLFTGKARDAARLLAVRCGHRGCDVPAAFCDVDHVDEWSADSGGTDQANALPLCGVHDRWKHEQRLRGRRDHRGRIHLVRPDGTVIKPLNARDPIWADPDPPRGPPPVTIPWDDWVASHCPDAPRHPDRTITIYQLDTAVGSRLTDRRV